MKIISNKKFSNRKSGFTLLEMLIATAVFAVIMVMTTGIIGQSIVYKTKLQSLKSVSEDSRSFVDKFTNDIRASRGKLTIKEDATYTYTFDSGIALFSCNWTTGTCAISSTNVNTAAIKTEKNINIYWFQTSNQGQGVLYKSYNLSELNIDGTFTLSNLTLTEVIAEIKSNYQNYVIAGSAESFNSPAEDIDELETKVSIEAFYNPADTKLVKQPFIKFKITSTKGIQSSPQSYAETTILTTVTSRDYNK